ncbi:hypothetical protein HYFRA_00000593 [Hymenoscyphus fraxineus]|uniref:Uncharacterized protein n=1 Tax=Hymenoscyphus fraxineus TaxID=746836 RepID=A0A9N9L344_9HELO|nr:hypothetical protein HYFRA_00000593 [Hymenoscyphus fraxineus]
MPSLLTALSVPLPTSYTKHIHVHPCSSSSTGMKCTSPSSISFKSSLSTIAHNQTLLIYHFIQKQRNCKPKKFSTMRFSITFSGVCLSGICLIGLASANIFLYITISNWDMSMTNVIYWRMSIDRPHICLVTNACEYRPKCDEFVGMKTPLVG